MAKTSKTMQGNAESPLATRHCSPPATLRIAPLVLLLFGCATAPPPLPRGAAVEGVLYDEAGPLRGVDVLVGGTGHRAESGANGRFVVPGVPPGEYRMVLSSGATSHVIPLLVPTSEDVHLGDLTLRAGGVVKGRPAGAPDVGVGARPATGLADVARAAGVDATVLQELAVQAGVSVAAWEHFLATGELPQTPGGRMTRKDLLRLAQSAREQIRAAEAEAILSALTGLTPDVLKQKLEKYADLAVLLRSGKVSQATLAKALRSLRENGELDESALAAIRAEEGGTAAGAAPAGGTAVLYDGSLQTLPEDQGWWHLTDPLDSRATQAVEEDAVLLDSTAERRDKAGFFTHDPVTLDLLKHPRLPRLDRRAGFTLHMAVSVAEEAHVREDRAGFSLIVICEDLEAIELGFWADRVWAQSDRGEPIFEGSRAEGAALDTSGVVMYDLDIRGDAYELLADGRVLLQDDLRNYTGFGGYPYNVPGFIFLGDNTTSGEAVTKLAWLSVSVPEDEAAARATAGYDLRDAARWVAAETGLDVLDAFKRLVKTGGQQAVKSDPAISEAELKNLVEELKSEAVARRPQEQVGDETGPAGAEWGSDHDGAAGGLSDEPVSFSEPHTRTGTPAIPSKSNF